MAVSKKIEKYLPAGAMGSSVIFHLAIFLAISGIVIVQKVTPKVAPSNAGMQ